MLTQVCYFGDKKNLLLFFSIIEFFKILASLYEGSSDE